MTSRGFALFDTAIGACAIAWGPERHHRPAAARSERGGGAGAPQAAFPRASQRPEPPPAIAEATLRIAAFLGGAEDDFADLPLAMERVGPLEQAVYREARAIPAGAHRDLRRDRGPASAIRTRARAVGQALGRNPWPIIIPCHRVTGADGKMGGFSAPGGRRTKLKLLEMEGALAADSLPLFGAR